LNHFKIIPIYIVQLSPTEFEEAMTEDRPQVLICSVEFLSSRKVKDVIYSCRLAPAGLRPLICIDEAQVEKNIA